MSIGIPNEVHARLHHLDHFLVVQSVPYVVCLKDGGEASTER